MTRHDQLFKDLIRNRFREFLHLAAPLLAIRLSADAEFSFLDKEGFLDFPEGRRHEVDLLVEVFDAPRAGGRFLIHVEIENHFRTDIGRRIARYSHQLFLRHPWPVISIGVFLHGGPAGAHWIARAERVLDLEVHTLRYFSFGVSRLPAETLLDRPEPLAWAFAALARPGKIGRARLKLELLQKIAFSSADEAVRFLLTNCVETYLQLTGREAAEYVSLRSTQATPEVEAMEMTWADRMAAQYMQQGLQQGMEKGLEKGLEKGAERLRNVLLRQLGKRFGEVSPTVRERVEAIESLDELEGLADRLLEVKSIEELGLGS
jgi:hypothetical protein